MNTKSRKSKLWGLFKILFPDADMNGVYLAFWNTIWMPKEVEVCPVAMVVHESVHLKQQGDSLIGALVWWTKYIFSKSFRLSQELEAYQVQVKWFDDTQGASYKQKFLYRKEIARILSSSMYGNIISEEVAFKVLN